MADLDLDLEAIDEQIRMLQSLRKLATDPAMRELISRFAKHRNGNGNGAKSIADAIVHAAQTESSTGSRGILRENVLKALSTNKKSPFTSRNIVDEMQRHGFEFKAGNPTIAVNEVFNFLMKDGTIVFTGERAKAQKLWVMGSAVQSRTA